MPFATSILADNQRKHITDKPVVIGRRTDDPRAKTMGRFAKIVPYMVGFGSAHRLLAGGRGPSSPSEGEAILKRSAKYD